MVYSMTHPHYDTTTIRGLNIDIRVAGRKTGKWSPYKPHVLPINQ
ncbi:MAG: hypothetical protein QXV02_07970 [Nitrososphaerota archaeon]